MKDVRLASNRCLTKVAGILEKVTVGYEYV